MKFNNNGSESVYFDVWKGQSEGRPLYSTDLIAPNGWGAYEPEDKEAQYTVHVWVKEFRQGIAAAQGGADHVFQFGLVAFK